MTHTTCPPNAFFAPSANPHFRFLELCRPARASQLLARLANLASENTLLDFLALFFGRLVGNCFSAARLASSPGKLARLASSRPNKQKWPAGKADCLARGPKRARRTGDTGGLSGRAASWPAGSLHLPLMTTKTQAAHFTLALAGRPHLSFGSPAAP